MVTVYGKPNCSQCETIKAELSRLDIHFEYVGDNDITMDKARELNEAGKLVEMTAPLVMHDGIQIRHNEIKNILGKGE